MNAYARSKLANLLFAVELARRTSGMRLISVAVHPGTSFTGLQQHSVPPFLRWAVRPLFNAVLGQSARQSAFPSLYGATASPMSSGSFIGPTGQFELRGAPGMVRLPERALDENVARALWEVSERLTQVSFPWHDETSQISTPDEVLFDN